MLYEHNQQKRLVSAVQSGENCLFLIDTELETCCANFLSKLLLLIHLDLVSHVLILRHWNTYFKDMPLDFFTSNHARTETTTWKSSLKIFSLVRSPF